MNFLATSFAVRAISDPLLVSAPVLINQVEILFILRIEIFVSNLTKKEELIEYVTKRKRNLEKTLKKENNFEKNN